MMTVLQLPHPARPGKSIRGRGLGVRKLSKAGRALLAADIAEGATTLSDLSIRQIAAVVGVSVAYVHRALRASPLEREAVRRGLRPLVQPHAPATPAERLTKIVHEIGHAQVASLLTQVERKAAA
jgi:hypothetical protein